jgi:ribosomal protein L44E
VWQVRRLDREFEGEKGEAKNKQERKKKTSKKIGLILSSVYLYVNFT